MVSEKSNDKVFDFFEDVKNLEIAYRLTHSTSHVFRSKIKRAYVIASNCQS